MTQGTAAVHVAPDPLAWTVVPARGWPLPAHDPQQWAACTTARFLDGMDHAERHDPFLRARLLAVWRSRLDLPMTRSFVHHSDLRLTTLDLSVRPAGPGSSRTLDLTGPHGLYREIDYVAHHSLGQAQRVMRFDHPGPTELGINAAGSLTLLWHLDEQADLLLELKTRCAERLLRLLPALDALLQTLTRCGAPAA